MRIAMWSGPRNLSTAMMYAFAARGDCAVWDEPFYAPYLLQTGLDHPKGDEIIAQAEGDPTKVVDRICGSIPGKNPHFYLKLMTQHMLPGIDRSWIGDVVNVFLIRHPARVVASYDKKRETPELDDIGFRQQAELYDFAAENGAKPVVIDSADIRENPQATLTTLCDKIGLRFTDKMLHWPKGGHADDGVWAPHWYPAVHNSTGFAGAEGPLPKLSGANADIAEQAMPFYQYLRDKI